MTTYVFAAAPINTSDDTFRAWGGGLSAALAAVGLVQTADTGQIDWATVTAPTSASQMKGYEIWRFNDALQATVPIFFKIEYGAYGASASGPGWRWTIGKGSDGAGAITGVILAATAFSPGAGSTNPSNWYVSSGDGSMLAIAPAPVIYDGSTSSLTWYLVLERSRSAAGAATGTGLLLVTGISGAQPPTTRQFNYALTTGIASYNQFPVGIPYDTPGLSYAGTIPMFPGICADGAGNFWQPRSILVGNVNDIGVLNQVSVPGWGTYLPVPWRAFGSASVSQSRAAIAWY